MTDLRLASVATPEFAMFLQTPESRCAAMRVMQAWPQVYRSACPSNSASLLSDGFRCGPGWYPLIERLSADIAAILDEMPVPAFRVLQVNQKFGGLRFRVTGSNERILNRIAKAQVEAAHTCEGCGGPSRIRSVDMWLTTSCDPCIERTRPPRR
ncbi:hypothetical protein PE067_20725 [Paracoccus sp. DMF-8]|uniref:hypothetical protein n=1 Tax=Paracoccus sp. DMF-8 TaxID=3019445 RepID=UPI0023E3D41E|nr:hypothetical protein [Paracoccus sp. DMF-8]MDF3608353.1 hypothetical protein [Paracoccus sp. DMF-8]